MTSQGVADCLPSQQFKECASRVPTKAGDALSAWSERSQLVITAPDVSFRNGLLATRREKSPGETAVYSAVGLLGFLAGCLPQVLMEQQLDNDVTSLLVGACND